MTGFLNKKRGYMMKLLCLNIWGGHVKQPLLDLIDQYRDVDFFCLQEVYHNGKQKNSTDHRQLSLEIFSEIQAQLPSHQGFFRPVVQGVYGQAMFIKKTIVVHDEDEVSIYHNPRYPGIGPRHDRVLQWAKCHYLDQPLMVSNVHGLWNGLGKTDTPDRLKQSHQIHAFVQSQKCPHILCGDFNLRPDTKSIELLGDQWRNLVTEFNVTSTRTPLYDKEEAYADYIFVSPDIEVNAFSVLDAVVSDHAPLYLDFTVLPLKNENDERQAIRDTSAWMSRV